MDREAKIRTKESFSLTAMHASVRSGGIEDNNEGRLEERVERGGKQERTKGDDERRGWAIEREGTGGEGK